MSLELYQAKTQLRTEITIGPEDTDPTPMLGSPGVRSSVSAMRGRPVRGRRVAKVEDGVMCEGLTTADAERRRLGVEADITTPAVRERVAKPNGLTTTRAPPPPDVAPRLALAGDWTGGRRSSEAALQIARKPGSGQNYSKEAHLIGLLADPGESNLRWIVGTRALSCSTLTATLYWVDADSLGFVIEPALNTELSC